MNAFEDLHLDHVSLAVGDLARARAWWIDQYGMRLCAGPAPRAEPAGVPMAFLGRADIRLLLTEAGSGDHPAAVYTRRHGDGVYDIALGTSDAAAAYREALRRGATPVSPPAMNSIVVQSLSGTVTLTLLEPDPAHDCGQIDQFLSDHDGPGIQHIAFAADDLTREVSGMGATGVEFLRTPGAYYDQLPQRLVPVRHSVERLRELSILVDQDSGGQLFQIFTRSVHPRGTLFFEIIERVGARTFGSSRNSPSGSSTGFMPGSFFQF